MEEAKFDFKRYVSIQRTLQKRNNLCSIAQFIPAIELCCNIYIHNPLSIIIGIFAKKLSLYILGLSFKFLFKKVLIYLQDMFDSHSAEHPLSWQQISLNPSNYLGNIQQVAERKELPWVCPVCLERFKWDTQLLRHERATNHQNSNRKVRRERKYKKLLNKTIKCTLCLCQFKDPLKRLQHARWCQNDPQTQKLRNSYKSSLQPYLFECHSHQLPWYFTDLDQLQNHIKTHRKFDQQKIEKIRKIFVWKKKWNHAGLTNNQYRKILEKYDIQISLSALRRIFKKA